jgi:hypothetical protein
MAHLEPSMTSDLIPQSALTPTLTSRYIPISTDEYTASSINSPELHAFKYSSIGALNKAVALRWAQLVSARARLTPPFNGCLSPDVGDIGQCALAKD